MVVGKKERELFVDEMEIVCMHLDGGVKRDGLQERKRGEIVMFCVNVFDWPRIFAMKALTMPNFLFASRCGRSVWGPQSMIVFQFFSVKLKLLTNHRL
jgi:hypothetical protein